MLLLSALLTGCHNRAYSDLYVENMAAEIRDLEDQLYEYDYQYRRLERELHSVQAELARVDAGTPQERLPTPAESLPSEEGKDRRDGLPREPEPLSRPDEIGQPSDSILEGGSDGPPDAELDDTPPSLPSYPSGGQTTPGANPLPDPTADAAGETIDPGFEGIDLLPPSIDEGETMLPPSIDGGEPMPPPVTVRPNTEGAVADSGHALELNLSRVEVPAKLAGQSSAAPEMGLATMKPGVQQVTDTRVVELAFHSSLSRAANFDDELDDDGLYLVLQPRNESGEMVPVAADLSVLVIDPSREGRAAYIGRRDYSAAEVKSKMQKIGTNQGIHLTMPWNGPDPGADTVLVLARYTFPNGRQVIGQKQFHVSSNDGLKTVYWAPRGSSGAGLQQGSAEVAQASHQADTSPQRVVRPAGGSAAQPAPLPQR